MRLSKMTWGCSLSLVLILLLTASHAAAQTTADSASGAQTSVVPARITEQIDNSVRVTIGHSTHPLVQAATDLGPLDLGTALNRMTLVLGVSEEVERDTRTLLDSQQTEGSPNYHQWLTPEAFGQGFGPSQQDIQTVTAWLQQQGFTVNQVARSGRWIEFSGTVAQVQTAFQTRMRRYEVGGEQHVANASDISIPAALAPVVRGVVSLHNFYSKPMVTPLVRARRNTDGTSSPVGPDLSVPGGGHAIAPGDFANIYNLNPLFGTTPIAINGANQKIALVAVSNINQMSTTGVDDVATFRQLFGLPVNPPNIILNGPDPGVDPGSAGGEATLDTEWSGAAAPNATIDLVVSGGTFVSDPVILSSEFIVNENLAPIMSSSFGLCEANLGTAGNAFWNGLWQQAAAQGISVFVATGDTGAAGCDPNMTSASLPTNQGANTLAISGFASTPFNTAVGGTEFNETVNGGTDATFWNTTAFPAATAKGYLPEMVWNDSCDPTKSSLCGGQFFFFSGGGGVSTVNPKPSYQTLNITGIPTGNFRVIPDVSLAASNEHDPYVLCFSSSPNIPDCSNAFSFTLAGGTSFSSPAFAGIMALVDQKVGGRQGLANYVLYSLAAAESPQFSSCNSSSRTNPATASPAECVFNDITVGNNTVPGLPVPPGGFTAGTGFDLASGLGTVDGDKLVNAWSTAAANFQGSQTALTASVNGSPVTTISVTHGQPVTLNVTVTKLSSTFTGTPTGNVGLVTDQAQNVNPTVEALALTAGTTSPQVVNILPGGTYNLSANYPGDGTFGSSTSNLIAVNIAPEASVVQVAGLVLPNGTSFMNNIPISYGTGLAIDALVTAASGNLASGATGTITFTDSVNGAAATDITSAITLNADGGAEIFSCQFGPVCLTAGTHVVNASFSGDPSLNAGVSSGSNTVTVTVSLAATTTTIQNPPITIPAGTMFGINPVTNTTSLGVAPTGTYTYFDGTTQLTGTAQQNNGQPGSANGFAFLQSSLNTSLSTPGVHNLTVKYSGDGNYMPSTSSIVMVTVTSQGSFAVSGAAAAVTAGNMGSSVITVTPSGGFTGTVAVACTGTLPPGVMCTPNPLNVMVAGAAAATGTLNISVAAPSSSMTASNIQAERTYAAQAATPQTGNKGGWWTLSGGTGLAAMLLLFVPGRKRYRAALLGLSLVCVLSFAMGCGGGGGGTTLTQTTTAITVSSTKVAQNGMLTVSAMVTGGTPTGTVQFVVDGTAAGNPVMLTNGSTGNITVTVTNTVGTHTLSAQYAGSSTTMASHSGTLNVTVTGTTQIAFTATATGSATVVNGNVSLTIN